MKLYVREPGTDSMVQLAHPTNGNTLSLLGLSRIEFRSAVRLRQRCGDITAQIAQEVIATLDQHWSSLYLVQPVTEEVVEQAAAVLDRHPLRAYDAMQLAGCIAVQPKLRETPCFVCADHNLLRAAEAEGFAILNPSDS